MANEQRIKRNFVYGTIATTFSTGVGSLTDPSFTQLPTIGSSAHMALTFQDISDQIFEIVYVIAHTAGSQTITVHRAQEGTSQQTWHVGASWVHAPTVRDQVSGMFADAQFLQGENYPTSTWMLTGARNLILTAYPNDVIQAGFNVTISAGATGDGVNFDIFTLVGGAKAQQWSKVMTTNSASFSGLPGAAFTTSSIDKPIGVTANYMVKATDITSNTVTLGWYAQGSGSFSAGSASDTFTQDGTGYNQRITRAGSTLYNRCDYGYFWARNLGPKMYVG